MNISTDRKSAGLGWNAYSALLLNRCLLPAMENLRATKTEKQSDDSRTSIHSLWDPTGNLCGDPRSLVGPSASGGCVMRVSLAVMEEITY